MITTIENLVINEFKLADKEFQITMEKGSCKILSIVLYHFICDDTFVEVFYGKVANELNKEILAAKLAASLGMDWTMELDRFNLKGQSFAQGMDC